MFVGVGVILSDTLVESVCAIRERLTPFSFVLLSFLSFRLTQGWRQGRARGATAPPPPGRRKFWFSLEEIWQNSARKHNFSVILVPLSENFWRHPWTNSVRVRQRSLAERGPIPYWADILYHESTSAWHEMKYHIYDIDDVGKIFDLGSAFSAMQ